MAWIDLDTAAGGYWDVVRLASCSSILPARIAVFAPALSTMRWVDNELAENRADLLACSSFPRLLACIQDARVAIVDVDAMDFNDVGQLGQVRQGGWRGSLIALGRFDMDLRRSLRIRVFLPRPFGSEHLRKAVGDLFTDRRRKPSPLIARAALDRSEFTDPRP